MSEGMIYLLISGIWETLVMTFVSGFLVLSLDYH